MVPQVIQNEFLPDCIILDNWVFENFISADERFGKALRIFENCVWVNNISCEKLNWSLDIQIKFNERFKVTLVPFFIPFLSY